MKTKQPIFIFSTATLVALFFILECQSPFLQQKKEKPAKKVTLAVVGDLMLHQTQLDAAYQKSCDCYRFDDVFSEVKPYLSAADITIGNLETTLPGESDGKDKNKFYSGYPRFGAPDSFIDALAAAGFDILATANNHSMDKGKAGVLRTIKTLDNKNILHLGTYESKTDLTKNRVLIVEKNGLRLAFLNYTYGTNGLPVPDDIEVNRISKERVTTDIKAAQKLSADAILILFHFGSEYARFPDNFQKNMVQFAFEQGADVVLGGHPHVLQPYEIVLAKDMYGNNKERLVIYSLGNFVSGQQRRYTNGGTIFQFSIIKESIITTDITRNITNKTDEKAASSIHFANITDFPVWVYFSEKPNSKNNARKIRILPAQKYAEQEKNFQKQTKAETAVSTAPHLPTKLSEAARKRLLLFYNDTTLHYRDSRDKIKAYLKEQP